MDQVHFRLRVWIHRVENKARDSDAHVGYNVAMIGHWQIVKGPCCQYTLTDGRIRYKTRSGLVAVLPPLYRIRGTAL